MDSSSRTHSLLVLIAGLAMIAALAVLRDVLEPLMIAIFLSFVAMPAVRFARRLRIPGPLSVLIVISVLLFVCGWVISLIYQSTVEFLVNIPAYEQQLRPHLIHLFERLDISTAILPPAGESFPWRKVFTSTSLAGYAGYAGSGLGGFLGWVGELLVVLTFLIFILLDRADGSLDRRIAHAFAEGPEHGEEVARVLDEINRDIERYIQVKTGISLLTGFLMTMVLSIFGVPFAILFGTVAFAFNFIPNVGSLLATLPPIVVGFVQFGNFWQVLPLALILLGMQATVGNFLDPWMMGRSLRLSPTTVLFMLILWNWLWGIPGMVLAVPIAVVIRIILLHIPDLRYIALLMGDEEPDRKAV
jgi:predicted PurR-regulated permease PerM